MFTSENLSLFRILSPSSIFSWTTIASIFAYFKCIVSFSAVPVKMKLGDNTLNNEWLLLVMTKLSIKKLTNCSPYFTALQYINNLETKRSYKRKVNLKNITFLEKYIERFKNYLLNC